jgi:hypothetical protein
MTIDLRLKGQEVSFRAIRGGVVVDSIDSVTSFDEDVMMEIKQDGFLGELVNRFDAIFNGFGGNFEFHVHNNLWVGFQRGIIDKAQRLTPDTVYNCIRTDFYPNGDNTIYTYRDVQWGAMPTTVASRGDYVKVKGSFNCSERPEQVNNLP